MQDLFSGLIIGLLGLVLLLLTVSRYTDRERPLLLLAYVAHVVAGFAQVLITVNLYGSGDIFGYARRGEELSAALSIDFQGMGWELLKLLFHQDAMLPITITGIGSSTGSMTAIAGFVAYFTGGSVYAGCVLLGVAGFFAKLLIYEVFRLSCPQRLHRRLLIANILVPSVVFWSSGLLKESVAMVGLGPMTLGVYRLLHRRPLVGLVLLGLGAVTIGLVKAYILFAFVIAAAAWLYTARAWKDGIPRVRPIHLAVGFVVAMGGVALLGRLFPEYSVDSFSEQAAYHQEVGQRVRGGSTYELVSPGDASASVQLMFAPLALLTSLYRPLLFEVNSAQVAVNAMETSALLGVTIWLLWRCTLRELWSTLINSPTAVFSLIFTGVMGVAVGLTTTNLGTLSRYRAPLVPYFASLLVILASAAQKTRVGDQIRSESPHRPGPSLPPSMSTLESNIK